MVGAADTPDAVAVIIVVPDARAVATPLVVIVATVIFDEPQTTVKLGVAVPSLKYPVAVNCCVVPASIEADVGVIVMYRKVGAPPELHAARIKMHMSETAANAKWVKIFLMAPPQRGKEHELIQIKARIWTTFTSTEKAAEILEWAKLHGHAPSLKF